MMRGVLFGVLVSTAMTALVLAVVDFSEVRSAFGQPVLVYAYPFLVTVVLTAVAFAYRWRILVDKRLSKRSALIATIISIGGNMFLPARGGDLLRLHFTQSEARLPAAVVFSRLLLEKVIDLVTVAVMGLVAAVWLWKRDLSSGNNAVVIAAGSVFAVVFIVLVALKRFRLSLIHISSRIFTLFGKGTAFDRHVPVLFNDVSANLTTSALGWPLAFTIVMWLTVYTAAYIFAARLVGVSLSYPEAMFVVAAGALGLMIPAAPSGIGTFHASVISAFVIMGRTIADGFIFATAVHFLLVASFAPPAGFLYATWIHNRQTRI